MSNSKCSITILKSCNDVPACKRFTLEEGILKKLPEQMEKYFDVEEMGLNSFEDLSNILAELEAEPNSLVIRGKLIAGRDTTNIRRTGSAALVDHPEKNFNPQSRRWCMLDIDDLELPEDYSDIDKHPEEILVHTISKLPEEFRSAACRYQFSANMGVKTGMIKVHLWYWLDRAVSDLEMKAWTNTNSEVPIDQALFSPVQVHYTAPPIFENGADDPLKNRSGIYTPEDASDTVSVSNDLDERVASIPKAARKTTITGDGKTEWIEPQEIIRDGNTGLVIDGREKLLYQLSLSVMTELVQSKKITKKNCRDKVDLLADEMWKCFEEEADISDGKYSLKNAREKASYRIDDFESGAVTFSSQSDNTTLYPTEESHYELNPVSREDGAAELDAQLTDFFDAVSSGDQPRKALRITMGAGKTTQTVEKLKEYLSDNSEKLVEVYVQRHENADEFYDKLSNELPDNTDVVHMYGRGGHDESKVAPLCERYGYVKELEKAGVSVFQNACRNMDGELCEFYHGCPYIKQFNNGKKLFGGNIVRILQHTTLGLPRISELEEEPDLVIIDEAFHSSVIKTGDKDRKISQPSEQIRQHFNHNPFEDLGGTIVDSLINDIDLLEQLRNLGVTRKHLKEIDFSHLQSSVSFNKSKSSSGSLGSNDLYLFLNRLSDILIDELSVVPERNEITRITYDPTTTNVNLSYVVQSRIPEDASILILDATADEVILDKLLGKVDVARIDIKQEAFVSQVYNRTGSNQFWAGNSAAIAELINVLNEWESFGEDVLCIGNKSLMDNLRGDNTINTDIKLDHFGAIRGSNAYEDCSVIFITGRNAPSPPAVEAQARALFWDEVEPLKFDEAGELKPTGQSTTYLPLELRGYTGQESGVNVNAFSDHRIEALHKQIREAETVQAIARLRLVHTEYPKRVYLLGNLSVEIGVDRLYKFEELMPDRLEVELIKTRNIPITPLGLLKMRPDLASNSAQARQIIRRSKLTDTSKMMMSSPILIRDTIIEVSFSAKNNGRTHTHRHLFLSDGQKGVREGGIQSTAANLPLDEWQELLSVGWGQISDFKFGFFKPLT
ncbi:hypothetical protein OAQ01_03165 [Emcibacteraceae bacterium]|nr:hypothetical protein [Emcibacteraceae bacterium]